MTLSLSATASAKLNLYLHITGRRDDGYHLLDSVFVRTAIGDEITVSPSDELSLEIEGPFADGLEAAENLITAAARLLAEKASVRKGARILLSKNLPVAAGIGGGSADAATTLLLLNNLWDLNLSVDDLTEVSLLLGADVPACLKNDPQWVRGIGEIIEPVALTIPKFALLVNPLEPLSTPSVFKAFKSQKLPFKHEGQAALSELSNLRAAENDLREPAITNIPMVGNILNTLQTTDGVELARLSGSGPTCFALYSSSADRDNALKKMIETYPDFWIQATEILL